MNLVRVLFKKQQQQQRGSSLDDGAPVDSQASSRRSPTAGVVEAALDGTGETSPITTRSPRRKARSTAACVHGVASSVKSSEVLSNPPPANVIFKAIKMSSHKRFAQVLPNLLLGT